VGGLLQVTVQFIVVPLTAVLGTDYTVSGNRMSLADGETMQLVPITLIRSAVPKLARSFSVRLLNSTTGGAAVGHPAECLVTILETEDAHGIFGNGRLTVAFENFGYFILEYSVQSFIFLLTFLTLS